MSNRVSAKKHFPKSVGFNAMNIEQLGPTAIVASSTNATNRGYFLLPFACKIPLITLFADTASPGITAFNVIVGTGAEVGAAVLTADNSDRLAPPTTTQTAGAGLFQAGTFPNFTGPLDKTVTLVVGVSQTFATSEPDAIFGQGTVLSLRYVSGATVNGNLLAAFAVIPVDPIPYRPASQSNGGWSWAADVA
jgi:hypothetical protein